MTDNGRLADELGRQLLARRQSLGLSKSELAQRAGKLREVVYRLEAGQDSTVSSLMAVLSSAMPASSKLTNTFTHTPRDLG